MAPRVAVMLLVGGLACASRTPPAEPAAPIAPATEAGAGASRAWRSAGGAVEVREEGAQGDCRLALASPAGSAPSWRFPACPTRQGTIPFASADGRHLLLVEPLPVHQGADWSGATLLVLVESGTVVRRAAGRDLVSPGRIGRMTSDFSWLRGAGSAEVQGAARLAPGGEAVELDTIDGRTLSVRLDGTGWPEVRPEPTGPAASAAAGATAARAEAEDETVYRWDDAEGGVHFAKLRDIPPAQRARVKRVTAEVGVVGGGAAARAPSADQRSIQEVLAREARKLEAQARATPSAAAAPAQPQPEPGPNHYQRMLQLVQDNPPNVSTRQDPLGRAAVGKVTNLDPSGKNCTRNGDIVTCK